MSWRFDKQDRVAEYEPDERADVWPALGMAHYVHILGDYVAVELARGVESDNAVIPIDVLVQVLEMHGFEVRRP